MKEDLQKDMNYLNPLLHQCKYKDILQQIRNIKAVLNL